MTLEVPIRVRDGDGQWGGNRENDSDFHVFHENQNAMETAHSENKLKS